MIRIYLKTALRNLSRNPFFTAVNLLGLVSGLTCCLLMVLYVVHEWTYDRFQPNGPDLVRMTMEYRFAGGEPDGGSVTSARTLPVLSAQFPEIKSGVRIFNTRRLVNTGEKVMMESRFLLADSTFFQVFNGFTMLKGNPQKALCKPNTVVLTETMARKYFDEINVVGKTLLISSNQIPHEITGVVADAPTNSQIRFDFVANIGSLKELEQSWWNANYLTYLQLQPGTQTARLESKMNALLKKEMGDQPDASVKMHMEPFYDVHLHSPYGGLEPATNIQYLYLMMVVAGMILAIAGFTYVNLSTARSMERAREIGIRKTIGARQSQVFGQFMGESVLLCSIAFGLSLLLAAVLLPFFNQVAGKALAAQQLMDPQFLALSLALLLCLALLAGAYPALVISRFDPTKVLKGAFKNTEGGLLLRKSLVVFQFGISCFLLCCTLGIRRQFEYIQNKQLGYDKNQVISLSLDSKLVEKTDLVKAELKKHPGIRAVSVSYESPVEIRGGYGVYKPLEGSKKMYTVNANPVDEDYVSVTGLQLVAGTGLTHSEVEAVNEDDTLPDRYAFILNEKCCALLGWTPESAIGQEIYLGENRPGKIKGVVKDFHFASMHEAIRPLVLFSGGYRQQLLVKTSAAELPGVLSYMETTMKNLAPYRPFEYRMLEEDFQALYASEKRTRQVFDLFSGLALGLACLGLLGLSVYSAQQRVKEIGIRKVLGASVSNLVGLLSRQFLWLIIAASVVSVPFSVWFLNHWFSDFAYRVAIHPLWFVGGAAMLVLISMATVGVQALRAVVQNPVKSLRTE